ncbi:MAG: exopolysaccharide biosynthesis polyprenyl glycosylphosphotransferase [Meiothermus sp.]|uniref:exopolysaccharide biosynthesis polyprenyl glycosylphosphotransferase n=1 Tax=Meiothermus sp. TaxID=1955249 RepID=UPI0025FC02D7|nr:exopolysaccharide biosynthesis polyprenyl glycosylphosphotransferase [Meiothermus sp.]MCS7068717.1 exopolysaccharide biosynthesis polyprenyl glycosylphosphotransferase [Meiothermus sp.]
MHKRFSFWIFLVLLISMSVASLASVGHARLWEAFTYPSYGGLMLLLAFAGGSSMWLANRCSRHPYTNALSSIVLATIVPFILLAAVFYVAGWGFSRSFYINFFAAVAVANLTLNFPRMRGRIRVCAISTEVEQVIRSLEASSVQVLSLDEVDSCDVFVADMRHESGHLPSDLLSRLTARGAEIVDLNNFVETVTGKVDLQQIPDNADSLLRPKDYIGLKRLWETAFVLISAPLWLTVAFFVAVAVRLDSKGPLIFKQRRVGLYGEIFEMYKFRSMFVDSEASGPRFAAESDHRITRVGRVIRKYRLDEIPQLWNVLKGDMSLIGPRPEQEPFVASYTQTIPLYAARHFVRPGITGWAQVVHGYTDDEAGAMEKLAYDLYYVKNFSLWLDLLVVMKTLGVILKGFGSR